MPIGAAVAVAGAASAGASIYSANKASKAASKAADQNAQIQQQQYIQTRADLSPYTQAGYASLGALESRLGLTSPPPTAVAPAAASAKPAGGFAGTSPASASLTPAAGQAPQGPLATTLAGFGAPQPTAAASPATPGGGNYDAYLSANPDVLAEYQRQAGNSKGQAGLAALGITTPEQYAAWHYQNFGQNEGRTLPGATPAQAAPTAGPSTPVPGQTLTDTGPRQSFTTPDYGSAPSVETYLDPSQFTTSPGYQFRLDQGIRNLNASYGAKGLLKSGAAMQGVEDYGQNTASQEYQNWYNQQLQKYQADSSQWNQDRAVNLAQFNTDRNVYDTNYNADRGYNTDLYNTYTGNLFNLTNMGQSAAAGTAAAGQNYAAQATANNNSLASVQGNAAIAAGAGANNALTGAVQYGLYRANPFAAGGGRWLPSGVSTSNSIWNL